MPFPKYKSPIVLALIACGFNTPQLMAEVANAGGMMDGRDIAAVLAAGATAVQLGTAF